VAIDQAAHVSASRGAKAEPVSCVCFTAIRRSMISPLHQGVHRLIDAIDFLPQIGKRRCSGRDDFTSDNEKAAKRALDKGRRREARKHDRRPRPI
jgi:hypothetical protein